MFMKYAMVVAVLATTAKGCKVSVPSTATVAAQQSCEPDRQLTRVHYALGATESWLAQVQVLGGCNGEAVVRLPARSKSCSAAYVRSAAHRVLNDGFTVEHVKAKRVNRSCNVSFFLRKSQ